MLDASTKIATALINALIQQWTYPLSFSKLVTDVQTDTGAYQFQALPHEVTWVFYLECTYA